MRIRDLVSALLAAGAIAAVAGTGHRSAAAVADPPPSAFAIDSLSAQRWPDGRQAIFAQVRNTGGRALDLTGDLKLIREAGRLSAGPFRVRTGTTLAPGDSGSVAVPLTEHLPDGRWRARVLLQSGSTRRTAEATIAFPIPLGKAETVKAETVSTYFPIAAFIIGVALLALGGFTFLAPHMKLRRP